MSSRVLEEVKDCYLNGRIFAEELSDKELVYILKAVEKQVKILSAERAFRVEKLKNNCPI